MKSEVKEYVKKNWALPEKYQLVLNIDHTISIVKLSEVLDYYEGKGYVFRECPEYSGETLFTGCSYPEGLVARAIIELLGFSKECMQIPNLPGPTIIPFGNDMAIIIAPRMDVCP